MNPLISVIFPCYNSEPFLKYSLESILNQDYKTLEIICINDGSSDRTLEILNEYKKNDNRIIIISNEKNLGLIASLNKALFYVSGEYFARMDADDYSPPERFSEQIKYLLANKHIDIVSSGCFSFKKDNQKNHYLPPIARSTKALVFLSIFANPFVHGSIFGKSSLIKTGQFFYDAEYPHAEDFELFSRLAWNNCSVASIDEPLYWLRINFGSVSFKFSDVQSATNLKIVKRNLNQFLKIDDHIDDVIFKILINRIDENVNRKDISKAFQLLNIYYKVVDEKIRFSDIDRREIEQYLSLHKLNIILQSNKFRFSKLKFKNLLFFISSLFMLNHKQVYLLIKKVLK